MEIELRGSLTAAATYQNSPYEITTTGKDPVPVLARRLIAAGADPDTIATVTRDGTPVWAKDRTLEDWGGLAINENDRGIRWSVYQPNPFASC